MLIISDSLPTTMPGLTQQAISHNVGTVATFMKEFNKLFKKIVLFFNKCVLGFSVKLSTAVIKFSEHFSCWIYNARFCSVYIT